MQADLFNLSMSNSFERQAFQRSFFERKYTLRFDQLLGLGLITIVFFVLVFAWGVEHGKAVSHKDFMVQAQAVSAPVKVSQSVAEVAAETDPSIAPAVEIAAEARSEVSVPAPRAPEVSVTAASSAVKYTIAHMTYVRKDQALGEMARIKSKGYVPLLVSSGKYFQICVNGFESRKAANEAIKGLRLKGIVSADSYVRNMPAAV